MQRFPRKDCQTKSRPAPQTRGARAADRAAALSLKRPDGQTTRRPDPAASAYLETLLTSELATRHPRRTQ